MSNTAPDSAGTASPSPSPRFRQVALASGLLEPEQIQAAEAHVRLTLDPATTSADAWDDAVAQRLVSQGLLTGFQAREMRAGRRRFRLGQYTVLDEIGRGGMGQVFKAHHGMMGREVALKVLPRAKSTPEYEAAFQREIRMLGRLDHENLVRALDAGHDAKVYYLVTELVSGIDLRKQVLKYGPLDELTAVSVIVQAARGLAYAHGQGLVHRDVKPGNLLVSQDGRVKVLDLGLAGSVLDEESTRTGRVVGTLDYMAPEQIRDPDAVGPAADVYALGCTFYFALTGRVPFPGGSRKEKAQRHLTEPPVPIQHLAPHMSADVCRVLEAMMKKSPLERIASAKDVIERLRPWTPRTLMPMPRTPVAGSKPRADAASEYDSLGSEAHQSPSRLATADASAVMPRGGDGAAEENFEVPQPPLPEPIWPGGVRPVSSKANPGRGEGQFLEPREKLEGAILLAARCLAVAAVAGLLFGLALSLVRGIDPGRFQELVGNTSPSTFGWGAFLLVAIVQVPTVFHAAKGR